MTLFRGAALIGAAALFGCAHVPKAPAGPSPEATLKRQLAESQAREVDLQRKVDDLNNRIFLLQDQLESRVVAASQKVPPRVPIDLRADASNAEDIEFSGAAQDANGPRPVLRLVGNQAPQRQFASVTGPPVAQPSRSSGKAGWVPPSTAPLDGEDRLPVTRQIPPVPTAADGKHPSAAPAATSAPVLPKKSSTAAADTARTPDAMKLYSSALDLLKHGQHAQAIRQLEQFVRTYPAHDYADNAQYWLGESYYDQKDFQGALREFRRVIQRFPSGNKAPDALLKVGYCYGQIGDAKNERDVLEQVLKSYPGTEVAQKAADKLQAKK